MPPTDNQITIRAWIGMVAAVWLGWIIGNLAK